jgi:hypothetical protein
MPPYSGAGVTPRCCQIQTAVYGAPQKILGSFVQQKGLGKVDGDMITANPAMVVPETVEGKMLAVLDEHGPVITGEDFADKCVAAGVNPITFYIA